MHIAQLSTKQLSKLIGYAPRSIQYMELGCNSEGKKVNPQAWLRYKLVCAAVDAYQRSGKPFDWGQ